ncbi:MAG: helicase, partial [Nanoarchaeota archaeon]
MSSDLTFITNDGGHNLKQRFEVLIKGTRFFDCLVGYFYTSGFHAIYKPLENTEKIRILIGISTNKQTCDLLNEAQQSIQFSHAEARQEKLYIKAYPSQNIHAKLYVMTFFEGGMDTGRVIT